MEHKENSMPQMGHKLDTSKVNRVEVIDNDGRKFHDWDERNYVEVQIQDDGKTLKIFISKPRQK